MRKSIRITLLTTLMLLVLSSEAFCFDKFLDQQLYSACESGTGFLIKILLIVGADANAKHPTEGVTPLMGAAGAGQVEAVSMLLAKGADPKAVNKNGESALTLGYHHIAIVKMLMEKGADVNVQPTVNGKKGMTPLMAATVDGDKDIVAFLLEKGADPTIKTGTEKTALELAEKRQFPEIIKMLSEVIAKQQAAAAAAGGTAAGAPPADPAAPVAGGVPGTAPASVPAAAAPPAATAPPAAAAPPAVVPPPAAAPPAAAPAH